MINNYPTMYGEWDRMILFDTAININVYCINHLKMMAMLKYNKILSC